MNSVFCSANLCFKHEVKMRIFYMYLPCNVLMKFNLILKSAVYHVLMQIVYINMCLLQPHHCEGINKTYESCTVKMVHIQSTESPVIIARTRAIFEPVETNSISNKNFMRK